MDIMMVRMREEIWRKRLAVITMTMTAAVVVHMKTMESSRMITTTTTTTMSFFIF